MTDKENRFSKKLKIGPKNPKNDHFWQKSQKMAFFGLFFTF